jgi:hypothetical protein
VQSWCAYAVDCTLLDCDVLAFIQQPAKPTQQQQQQQHELIALRTVQTETPTAAAAAAAAALTGRALSAHSGSGSKRGGAKSSVTAAVAVSSAVLADSATNR